MKVPTLAEQLRSLRAAIDQVLDGLDRLAPALAAWTASGSVPFPTGEPQERVGSLSGSETAPIASGTVLEAARNEDGASERGPEPLVLAPKVCIGCGKEFRSANRRCRRIPIDSRSTLRQFLPSD